MRGFVSHPRHKTPDSFDELNAILENTTPFPPRADTHTCAFQRPTPGESRILAVTIPLFLSPHTDQMDSERSHDQMADTLTHTHARI